MKIIEGLAFPKRPTTVKIPLWIRQTSFGILSNAQNRAHDIQDAVFFASGLPEEGPYRVS
jgi:hypothetical protein